VLAGTCTYATSSLPSTATNHVTQPVVSYTSYRANALFPFHIVVFCINNTDVTD